MNVTYQDGGKIAYYNGYRFTRDEKTGYYLSSVKIDGKRRRLHVYVFMTETGYASSMRFHVHHIDGDKGNNTIENLALVEGHTHVKHHSTEYAASHLEELREAANKIRPLAKEWHRTQEGREWHRKHYESTKQKLHIPVDYVCAYCGKTFQSTKVGARFCCNAHRTAYRYHNGVDNVERTCVICGKPFSVNKYIKTKTCSPECKSKYRRVLNALKKAPH